MYVMRYAFHVMRKHIAILDFGSQYTHLIARRVRELNVLAKIYPSSIASKELSSEDVLGIVVSGGPQSVYDNGSLKIDPKILKLQKPILGLCYGHQLITHMLGGKVKPGGTREYGKAELNIHVETHSSASLQKTETHGDVSLLNGVSNKTIVWMSHGDSVVKIPIRFKTIASTEDCEVAGMADEKRQIYGLQFHPEVHHTKEGAKIIENFVFKICKAKKNWKIDNLVDDLIQKIVETYSNVSLRKNVFILVSGGVDSSVAFALLTRALGKERVLGLYIDTGFMRLNESVEIKESFMRAGFDNFETYDASKEFYVSLKNIYDPEKKRQIIGQVFLDAKDEVFAKLKLNSREWLLGQGTIYPDTIETGGTKHADTIKTHHNRIDAIQKMVEQGLVVEPLVDFYKDEVREIGKLLKLTKELIERHPFPGPGLAIRCLCSQMSDVGYQMSDTKLNLASGLNFALLPIKSVGVQGDNRTYEHPVVIWGEDNWNELDEISRQITNKYKSINRVLLLVNHANKNHTFGLPKSDYYLTRERIELLRKIDAIVMAQIRDAGLYNKIWQFPVVLVPVGREINGEFRESIVLRPVISKDAMTSDFARIKAKVLEKIVNQIIGTGEISYIFYDITNKPPGTIEWE